MIPQIIHNFCNKKRRELLHGEITTQAIPPTQTHWWAATVDKDNPVRGCHLSHRNIVRWAQMKKIPEVLIWEDDVMFTAPGAFQYFLDNKPLDYDIYTAGVYGQGAEYDHEGGTIKRMSGTHCYIVHSRFYDRLIALDENDHMDLRLSQSGAIIKLCCPMTALQHPGYSEILNKEVDYNIPQWVVYPLWK